MFNKTVLLHIDSDFTQSFPDQIDVAVKNIDIDTESEASPKLLCKEAEDTFEKSVFSENEDNDDDEPLIPSSQNPLLSETSKDTRDAQSPPSTCGPGKRKRIEQIEPKSCTTSYLPGPVNQFYFDPVTKKLHKKIITKSVNARFAKRTRNKKKKT